MTIFSVSIPRGTLQAVTFFKLLFFALLHSSFKWIFMKFLGNYNPAYLYFNCISTLSILFSAFTSVGLFGKNRLIINFHLKADALGYG